MQNPIPEFRQSPFISEKPGILFKKLNILTSSTTIEFNIFCWMFAHVSYLTMSTKWYLGFFFNYV